MLRAKKKYNGTSGQSKCFDNYLNFCIKLSVDDLATLRQIQTMANQIVSITVSDSVSVSDQCVLLFGLSL